MDKQPTKRNPAVIIRYSMMQLPEFLGLVLILLISRYWFVLSENIYIYIILIWIFKDVILYQYMWPAYIPQKHKNTINSMIGKRGYVLQTVRRKGYGIVNGEVWQIESENKEIVLDKGDLFTVLDSEGLCLIVKPDHKTLREK
ncbi:MAG: hypothetical protein GF313_04500 [Caldithrix sp.]|nr:hypothetical protein [Caldithrix sp.]